MEQKPRIQEDKRYLDIGTRYSSVVMHCSYTIQGDGDTKLRQTVAGYILTTQYRVWIATLTELYNPPHPFRTCSSSTQLVCYTFICEIILPPDYT
jgi:hypothetical protein